MLKSIKNAFQIKELRKKLLFTLAMIVIVRIGSQIPVPGIDTTYFKKWFAQNADSAFNIFSAFSGGSFESFSLFALGITPYITASIVIQLLTVVIPALEQFQKDGEYGKKKLEWINRWTAVGLSFAESIAMAYGFGKSGLLPNMNIFRGIVIVVCLTGGSGILIFIGELIKKKGIGNGISVILAVNILSRVPASLTTLSENFVSGKRLAKASLATLVIIAVIVATLALVVLLNEAQRNIPVQYSRKMNGRQLTGSQASKIPVKVNVAGVMPVIFSSTILSIPQLVAAVVGKGYGSGISAFILNCVNQNNWFNPAAPQYSVGLIGYIVMMYFFGYFYTSISFNALEVADNLKKQGGCIPGLRPGKPTEEYIEKVVNHMVFIGTTGLLGIVMIPTVLNGLFGAHVSFGGTSIIIIVGVVLETLVQIESEMQVRNLDGFLMGKKENRNRKKKFNLKKLGGKKYA